MEALIRERRSWRVEEWMREEGIGGKDESRVEEWKMREEGIGGDWWRH